MLIVIAYNSEPLHLLLIKAMVEGLGWGRNPPASRAWKGDLGKKPRFPATGGVDFLF